ncbi:hypothetical protein NEF87_003135 [Candidatus Lokiarchaeum ossiferum]|uniref:Uncharacterized protein n=1 Tax=Candidatus Lokiarchaeum ossiferum TaxID=2951803 RepID=A0ABY6HTU3_9ARCH|nr:hypothetical protein NEF87_003135 [Candidatus Lokiarchaeum sp. B-35]
MVSSKNYRGCILTHGADNIAVPVETMFPIWE